MTDFLIGLSIGVTCTLGLSIAFILFCMRWAKTHHEPSQYFEGEIE